VPSNSPKGLLTSGLRERAEVNRWLLFTATELEQPSPVAISGEGADDDD
jgi:hypothetical protein